MERSTALATSFLFAAILAIAAFFPLWRGCPPEGKVISQGSHDAAFLLRRLKAALRGVTCGDRERISLFRKLSK